MEHQDLKHLVSLLEETNKDLKERERDLADQKEELQSQKEELTAAIEELISKNNVLTETLQKLQQRNQELDQILYRTSHDLKTPVSSFQGLLDLLNGENLNESQKNISFYMQQKVLQMNGILKSLGMLAQASFEKIEIKPLSLQRVTQQVIEDLSYLPNFPNVSINIVYNSLQTVTADELILYNILKSLVSNAIIFRDSIAQGEAEVKFAEMGKSLVIEVSDNGDGIDPAIGSRIFEMFFRGSSRSHGSGLGLYIVKSIVERVKGEIKWTSSNGKTIFQVILPQL